MKTAFAGDLDARVRGRAQGLPPWQGRLARRPLDGPRAGARAATTRGETAVDRCRRCKTVGDALTRVPDELHGAPQAVQRMLDAKRQDVETGDGDRLGHRRGARLRHAARRRVRRCASPGRTSTAAPSATATRCSSTATPAGALLAARPHRAGAGAASSRTTACSPKLAVLGFEYGYTLGRSRTRSSSGRRSSATSSTARR